MRVLKMEMETSQRLMSKLIGPSGRSSGPHRPASLFESQHIRRRPHAYGSSIGTHFSCPNLPIRCITAAVYSQCRRHRHLHLWKF